MQAQAVVFTAPGRVEFGTVTCPDPGPDDAVVRVTHSWISNGTEGSFLRGERIAGDTARRQGDPMPFPIVAGYQKIGVVEHVGAHIDDLEVGETVFAAMGRVDGMFQPWGGQLSPSVSPRAQIWKLPNGGPEPLAYAALVLTQVGYNCGSRPPLAVGDGAVVIGDGMVGHWAAQTLGWRGAEVILVGRHEDRLARFQTGPTRHTANAREEDWLDLLKRALPGGARVIVDTVGSIRAVEQCLPLLVREGHIVSAGFYGTEDRLALQPLRSWEASVDTVSGWTRPRMDATRALIAGNQLQTLPLITHRFPARRAAEAWALIEQKTEPVLGVILDWD
ncbi:MAG: zinc-binding dehydrogenase [Kiritimatiellaeota bacterium]|nr:zinc-binding dehydrogenase [Kiritimatiellota bacterium]